MPVLMRGLMATSFGRLMQVAWMFYLLSPYVFELLNGVGVGDGPTRAYEAETLIAKLHTQVQERVFEKGYRIVVMPTVSSPFIMADLFHTDADVATATGMKYVLTWPWNLLNRYPVIDVPLGLVEQDMPTGMQAAAAPFRDLDAFQFAYNWSKWRPQLFADGWFPGFG